MIFPEKLAQKAKNQKLDIAVFPDSEVWISLKYIAAYKLNLDQTNKFFQKFNSYKSTENIPALRDWTKLDNNIHVYGGNDLPENIKALKDAVYPDRCMVTQFIYELDGELAYIVKTENQDFYQVDRTYYNLMERRGYYGLFKDSIFAFTDSDGDPVGFIGPKGDPINDSVSKLGADYFNKDQHLIAQAE